MFTLQFNESVFSNPKLGLTMTHISGYGYDLFTIPMFMTVIGHKVEFSCISFSLESILSSLLMVIKCLFYDVVFV